MIRETIYGDDAPFNYEHLKDLHNANLADGLGNLFRRGLSLCGKYTDVNAPTIPIEESDIVFDTAAFVYSLDTAMRELRLKDMTLILMDAVGKANKYLTDQEPWKMKNQPERQRAVVHTVLECCYYFAHVLLPICPIAGMLNTKLRSQCLDTTFTIMIVVIIVIILFFFFFTVTFIFVFFRTFQTQAVYILTFLLTFFFYIFSVVSISTTLLLLSFVDF